MGSEYCSCGLYGCGNPCPHCSGVGFPGEREEEQEPEVVPCFKCGCQMYQESHDPRGNICSSCMPEKDD